MKKLTIYLLVIAMVVMLGVPVFAASAKANIGINVLLNTEVSEEILSELGSHGKVQEILYELDALTMKVKANELAKIQALDFVEMANPDAERKGAPIDTIPVDTLDFGLSSWNLDAINITDFGFDNRVNDYDGSGVYIAVLDTGLVDSWRQYFPDERIAVEYAKSFGGGGGMNDNVSEQPNKWEHDQSSHGTHVTSTILGYNLNGTPINGAAPNATVIPVKVLNQNGSGWSSVISRGIMYIADLKEGPLADYPVVINMSLGGSALDPIEKTAIDYAIKAGVIIVASAGNEGEAGMGYPGAYAPVISVAAAGWVNEWTSATWWTSDVSEPTNPDDFYIADFSSVAFDGQDLDVAAPGAWIVGPYQVNSGKTSYYYMSGTSMASPHVAGVVALLAQQDPGITAAEAETLLEDTALDLTYFGPELEGSGMVNAAKALGLE